MDRDNIHFLYNISKDVKLNGEILNELSNINLKAFFTSGEITSIGKTICSTINILLPYLTNLEDRLFLLENIPSADFLEANPILKPPSPKNPPPLIKFSFKKKRKRHTR
tara:strand:+ start:309 stop:635 length:327 start_codon:yes stop_codon:yes gene_type:complete